MTEFERAAEREVLDKLRVYAWFHRLERDEQDQCIKALTSHARPAAGFIREATGPDRKVLGTLPVTADGCVAGEGARIIFPQLDGSLNYEYVCARGVLGPIQSGYSTPAAAQAESKETP